jgi:hypothetical protein
MKHINEIENLVRIEIQTEDKVLAKRGAGLKIRIIPYLNILCDVKVFYPEGIAQRKSTEIEIDVRRHLSPGESEIFDYLVKHEGQARTINEICNNLKLPMEGDNQSTVFRNRISRLRNRLRNIMPGAERCIRRYRRGYCYIRLDQIANISSSKS